MPPDIAIAQHRADFLSHVPDAWRAPLARLAVAWVGLILLFLGEWADMAAQWWDSSTYNHILLVPFILVWLVKLRASEVIRLTPQGWWPGLVLLAGALFVWLLGNLSGLNLASQLGAVLLLQASAIALLGPRVSVGLLFPLLYMFFLVPVGDALVPTLQLITAELTIALTHLSGVPAHIDGVFIDTPAGLFEVAEACSGVKFLIAMIALGALVSHMCFKSWTRRAIFMAVAILLPIVANGVRAWGTVFIAQSQGVEFAAGFDHIFYGWIFFALVMAALLGMGWRFFDRPVDDSFVDVAWIERSAVLKRLSAMRLDGWLVLGSIAFLSVATFGYAAHARSIQAPLPDEISLPEVAGWERVGTNSQVHWEPRAAGADRRLLGSYRNEDGAVVEVFYALYSAQEDGKEAGSFGEGALMPDTAWRWAAPGPSIDGGAASWLQAMGSVHRFAVTWYRTGDLTTGSNPRLKIANMADRLTITAHPTMTLIVSAEGQGGHDPERAVRQFLTSVGPVGPWMDGIAQLP